MRVGIALFFDRSTPMSFASHTTSNQLNRLVIVPHAVPLGSRPCPKPALEGFGILFPTYKGV